MAFYAPISVMLLPLTWIILLMIGFTSMFWAIGVSSPGTALSLSGASLTTEGFIAPKGVAETTLYMLARVIGLGIVGLLITFLPTVYSIYSQREEEVTRVAFIRRSWFPREFAPGCRHGTIDTPPGELVEGKHQAAWPYELWQRMAEVKASQYRRPMKEAQKRPHEFSRIIVCAACRRPLRVGFGSNSLPYYRDTSLERKLACSATGSLTVRSSLVAIQFGDILRSVELPVTWREAIAERCQVANSVDDVESERIRRRRGELDNEQKRLIALFRKGYITEQDLDEQMDQIRSDRDVHQILHGQSKNGLSCGYGKGCRYRRWQSFLIPRMRSSGDWQRAGK